MCRLHELGDCSLPAAIIRTSFLQSSATHSSAESKHGGRPRNIFPHSIEDGTQSLVRNLGKTFLWRTSLLVAVVNVESPPKVQIDSANVNPSPASIVDLGSGIEYENQYDRDIVGEEVLRVWTASKWPDSQVELDNDEQCAHNNAEVRRIRPGPSFPWEVVRVPALELPGCAKTYMTEADHAPSKQGEQ